MIEKKIYAIQDYGGEIVAMVKEVRVFGLLIFKSRLNYPDPFPLLLRNDERNSLVDKCDVCESKDMGMICRF